MSRYRPKDNIFKTLSSYAKNYVHEVKKQIKSSKIVKNGPQIVKNENFPKMFVFLLFRCHNEHTCQKWCLQVEWGGLWPRNTKREMSHDLVVLSWRPKTAVCYILTQIYRGILIFGLFGPWDKIKKFKSIFRNFEK